MMTILLSSYVPDPCVGYLVVPHSKSLLRVSSCFFPICLLSLSHPHLPHSHSSSTHHSPSPNFIPFHSICPHLHHSSSIPLPSSLNRCLSDLLLLPSHTFILYPP